MNNTLTERIGEIEKIVTTQGYIEFMEDTAGFFGSCIGFIRDTEEALESYITEISNQVPLERGKTILYAFGACQAIFIQQDAVNNLCFLLDIDYPDIPLIKEIREIRNDLAHPTDRQERGFGKKYSRITNVSRWGTKVDLMTSYPTLAKYTRQLQNPDVVMTIGFNTINIPDLIEKQKKVFIIVLDYVLEIIKDGRCPLGNSHSDGVCFSGLMRPLTYCSICCSA